jgi:hypothetical protein
MWRGQDLNLYGSKDRDEKLAKLHRDPEGARDDEIEEFLRSPEKFTQETLGAQ